MNQNQQITTNITDIEPCRDKNLNPYYKLNLAGYTDYFYAFSYNLPENTLKTLAESPHKLVNQPTLITYEELPNKDNQDTFFRVRTIELIN